MNLWKWLFPQTPPTVAPQPIPLPQPPLQLTPTPPPEAGSVWSGYATWTTDPHIGRPGYYALEDDGRTLIDPLLLLTWVDEAPDNPEDGSGHYEVADLEKPYFPQWPVPTPREDVELAAVAETTSGVSAGDV